LRDRLDKLLVELGLAPSRERAKALIMAGKVLVNEAPATKAGMVVDSEKGIRVRGADHPYVSRGGVKLVGALEDRGVEVAGKTVLDVGASTGGFTDACLQGGAARVFAVDVGTNQLDYSLRVDSRVTSMEKMNARNLTPDQLPGAADLAVIDVSFISLTLILGPVSTCLRPGGEIVAMIKPQFEVGKGKVGKGGVVRDEGDRQGAVARVVAWAEERGGLEFRGRAEARIRGPKGNQEIFVHLAKPDAPS